MSLAFLNQTPMMAFRRLEKDIKLSFPKVDLNRYKGLTPRKLDEHIDNLTRKEREFPKNSLYGAWLIDPAFVETKLVREALVCLREDRTEREESEVLVPGFTYYKRTKQFGSNLVGYRCFYLGENQSPAWVNFSVKLPVAKALEVLRHGVDEQFKKIYVEMANGRVDGLQKVQIEHITESSKDALALIESYCDSQWEGAWPWEINAPIKLKSKIEEVTEMREESINEMRGRFESLLRKLQEGEMEKYEVVTRIQEMADKIKSMIEDLGRISGEGLLTLKDQARVRIGDRAADLIEKALTQPVSQAADILSKLRLVLTNTLDQIANQPAGAAGGAGGMPTPGADGSLPAPGDMEGGDPMAGGDLGAREPVDTMADATLDGDDAERPKKPM